MNTGRVLVAGIGNIFFGDDGWGVAVAARLAEVAWPDGVEVRDFGIRGVHLAYELLDGYDALVLVDAMDTADEPGMLTVFEPDLTHGWPTDDHEGALVDAHRMSPAVVLATLAGLGGRLPRTIVLGCQPATLGDGIGLSPPVAAAVNAAVDVCPRLVRELINTS